MTGGQFALCHQSDYRVVGCLIVRRSDIYTIILETSFVSSIPVPIWPWSVDLVVVFTTVSAFSHCSPLAAMPCERSLLICCLTFRYNWSNQYIHQCPFAPRNCHSGRIAIEGAAGERDAHASRRGEPSGLKLEPIASSPSHALRMHMLRCQLSCLMHIPSFRAL